MKVHQFGLRSGAGNYSESEFGEDAEVYGKSTIYKSVIADRAKVFNASVFNSVVKDDAIVVSAVVRTNSNVGGHAIVSDHANVAYSRISGNAKVMDDAVLNCAIVRGNAQICGKAVIVGTAQKPVVFDNYDYADRGVWKRAPLTFVASSGFVISENVDDLVTVSCTTNTVKKWLSGAGRRYGKLVGLSPQQVDEIQDYVERIGFLKSLQRKKGEEDRYIEEVRA